MDVYRTERLGRLIQEKISSLILDSTIKDHRVTPFVSITRVSVSRDLSYADISVSNIQDVKKIQSNVEGLQSAAKFIQSQLGSTLRLRKIPYLRFHADTSIQEGFDVVQRLESLVDSGQGDPANDGA